MSDQVDKDFLNQALLASENSPPKPTCFRVGAVLVDGKRRFVAEGFTLEFGEGWHAEAVAVEKARRQGADIKGGTVYTTIEPCSVRASGKRDCTSLLIEVGIARVVFALKEPPVFVKCEGEQKLLSGQIQVEHLEGIESAVLAVNKHLFA